MKSMCRHNQWVNLRISIEHIDFHQSKNQTRSFCDEQLKREQFGPNTMKVTPCSCAQRGVENHISASVQASHLHSSWFSWQWSLTGCSCCVGSRPAGLRWARWWSSPNGAGQTVCPPTMAHRKWTKSAAAWCPQKERSFDWGTGSPSLLKSLLLSHNVRFRSIYFTLCLFICLHDSA